MNFDQIKEEICRVIHEAIKHHIGDFNDHEAHLLMIKEIDRAISKYFKSLKEANE